MKNESIDIIKKTPCETHETINTTYDIVKKYVDEKDKYDDEPFYIVDLGKVEEQYNKWVNYLPNIQPYFAVKSNPDNIIINMLAKLGCNFDCASKSELENALNIVNNPDRIIYANPCKNPSYIKYAKNNKNGIIEVLKISSILTKPEDFTFGIEPSAAGSLKLVNEIMTSY